MDNSTVKVVFRKSPVNPNLGNLHIRTTSNRKSQYKSLGIKIHQRHWDNNSQRVKPSLKAKHKEYNKIIDSALESLKMSLNNNIEVLKTSSTSILDFWDSHNADTPNAGTGAARKSSRAKFKKFLISIDQLNVKFQHLNPQLVQQYYIYLTQSLTQRTCKTYMAFFKSVVNQALKQQVINQYRVDPFLNIRIPTYKNKKAKALSIEQIKMLMDAELTPKQSHYRNMFIFQILAGGLRVRDLLFLKWNNVIIQNGVVYLHYTQVKTGKQITSKLSHKSLFYFHEIFQETHPKQLVAVDYNLKNLNNQLEILKQWEKENKYNQFDNTQIAFSHYDVQEQKRYKLDKIRVSEAQRITIEQNIKMYSMDLMLEYIGILRDFKKSNDFIFPSLQDINIPRRIDAKTNVKIMGKIANYNYHLKQIGQSLEIDNLTSHVARHSFAQLLVGTSANLHHIQQILGHSDLTITENYISSLHSTHLDNISDTLASHF